MLKPPNLLRTVQPFIAVVAVIATASVLVFAIYFTLLDLAWIAFLAGILFAGLIAVVSRATRAEFAAASRGARLAVVDAELAEANERAQKLEAMLGRANALLQFADEMQPALIAYIDAEGIYRYHNRAFRRWLDLPAHRIDGRHVPEALGRVVYAQIEANLTRALEGETMRYQRTHKMADGANVRLNVQLLPMLDAHGKPNGVFAILTHVIEHAEARPPDDVAAAPVGASESLAVQAEQTEQAQFNAAVAEQATGMSNARARILAAFQRNEFLLYGQCIQPLDPASGDPKHYEILIRLLEEENNMIAPGAFFPLAEEHGLLPHLDRWVIANLLSWAAGRQAGRGNHEGEVYFVNIATATLLDADFPDYVVQQLHKHDFPGEILCFEIAENDLASHGGDAEEFVRAVKAAGCKVALSGFGRNHVSVNVLKHLPLDFLKIDGSVVLQMLRDPVSLSKVVAINRVARTIGIATIAEMVEDEVTIARLRKIAVQYGQGFGVSAPQPLSEVA